MTHTQDTPTGDQYARDIECAIGLNAGGTGTAMVHAVRDAILNVRDEQIRAWRHKAIERAIKLGRAESTLLAVRELATEDFARDGDWGDGYRTAQADLLEVLNALNPQEQP